MDEQKIWIHFQRDWEIHVLKVKVWVFVSLVPQFTLYYIRRRALHFTSCLRLSSCRFLCDQAGRGRNKKSKV